MQFLLTSPAFVDNGDMPARFTCDGADVSPLLRWSGTPQKARSLALIVDDPDAPDPAAPKRTWVHWVLYNIPVACSELPEDISTSTLPAGTRQGINDWGNATYGGPCPPIGRHRYFFRLYALDCVFPDLQLPHKAHLLTAMRGHVLAESVLVGTYQKKKAVQ